MADTITTIPRVEPEHAIEQQGQPRSPLWHRLALAAITLISVFMNFFQLGQNGFGSYYPAAVRSMMDKQWTSLQPRNDPMSVPPRITRRLAWPSAPMALNVSSEDLEEDSTQTLLAMALLPLLQLPLLLVVMDHLTLGGMEWGNHRQEDRAVVSSILGLPIRCVSLPNHWQARSPGSCHWHSLA